MSAGVDPPMAMRNRVLKKRNGEWKLSGNKIFGIEYLDESEFDKPANRPQPASRAAQIIAPG